MGDHMNANLPTTAMLGQRVEVTHGDDLLVEGVLLAFGDDGTFIVQEDDGDVQFCWPLLSIAVLDASASRSGVDS